MIRRRNFWVYFSSTAMTVLVLVTCAAMTELRQAFQIALALLLAVLVYVLVRNVRLAVFLEGNDLVVRNPLRTYRIESGRFDSHRLHL